MFYELCLFYVLIKCEKNSDNILPLQYECNVYI